MASTVAIQLGVSLPVVVDFRGTLARGVTQDLGFDSISFLTDCTVSQGASVTVVLNFSRNVAYMPLSGRVTAVAKEGGNSPKQFRVDVTLSPLGNTEQRILESVFQELQDYLRTLGMPDTPARASARAILATANPRSILSLFITDNPYRLPYRFPIGPDAESRHPAQSMGSAPYGGAAQDETRISPSSPLRPDTTRLSWRLVWQGVGLLVQLFRDLIVRHLPSPLARLLTRRITFAFIGHPRTLADVPRKFPFARLLPARVVERWFRYQWPFLASYITGLTLADGTPTTGAMLISPLTTEQMIGNPALARRRVLQTIRLAEKMGARVAGLGAFTSIVTRDGKLLRGKAHLGLTTGNPHSAAIAVQNVLQAAALTNLSLPHATVAIVGGAGSVGSACAKMLARLVATVIIIDIKKDALQNLVAQLADQPSKVKGMTALNTVHEADIVIAATNNPRILLTADHLKPGAIVIDAAQPKNVSEDVPHKRPDVLVIESAIVETPDVNVHFDLDLGPNEALGCLSEIMILTAIGWKGHYSLGKADPAHAEHIIASGRELGFRLAPFRNAAGYVTEADLQRVAQARRM